jgi:hypothetical protein
MLDSFFCGIIFSQSFDGKPAFLYRLGFVAIIALYYPGYGELNSESSFSPVVSYAVAGEQRIRQHRDSQQVVDFE